jgi:hypothetical protein
MIHSFIHSFILSFIHSFGHAHVRGTLLRGYELVSSSSRARQAGVTFKPPLVHVATLRARRSYYVVVSYSS